MKKISLVLLLVFFSFSVFAQEVERHHMKWTISGTMDSAGDQFCVGEPVSVKIINHNTHRAVTDAQVRVYYGIEKVDAPRTGPSGIAIFTPNQTGVYKLYMAKYGYMDAKDSFTVTECGDKTIASTTTSTVNAVGSTSTTAAEETGTTAVSGVSATTIEASSTVSLREVTTTQAPASTTSAPASSGTAAEETCTDKIQNQGETGVDCGGPCKSCPGRISGLDILLLIFAAVVIVGIVLFFFLKGGRGANSGSKEEKEKKRKRHDKKHRTSEKGKEGPE